MLTPTISHKDDPPKYPGVPLTRVWWGRKYTYIIKSGGLAAGLPDVDLAVMKFPAHEN